MCRVAHLTGVVYPSWLQFGKHEPLRDTRDPEPLCQAAYRALSHASYYVYIGSANQRTLFVGPSFKPRKPTLQCIILSIFIAAFSAPSRRQRGGSAKCNPSWGEKRFFFECPFVGKGDVKADDITY